MSALSDTAGTRGVVPSRPFALSVFAASLAIVAGYLICVAERVDFFFFLVAFSLVVLVTALVNFDAVLIYIPLTLANPYTLSETGSRLHLSELVLLIIFAVWFFRLVFTEHKLHYDWRFLAPALAIIAAAMLSYTVARYPGEAVKQIVRYIEVLLVFFLVMTNTSREAPQIKRLVLYLIIGGLLASIVGLVQFLTGSMAAGATRRVYGWHGGGYGAVVSATFVLSLVQLMFEKDRALRLWSAVTLPVAGVVLILAQTRAWIGALMLVLLILLSRVRRDIALRMLVAGALLGAAVWVLIQTEAFGLVSQDVIEGAFKRSFRFVGSRKDAAVEDLSIFMRFNVWIHGVGYFLAHPLTGIGVGSLRIQDYFTARLGPPEEGVGFVDNQYLQFFAETGIVGGVAWVTYVIVGVRLGWRVVKRQAGGSLYASALGLWGSYLVYAIGSFFWVVTPHHELFAFMILFVALLVNISRIPSTGERILQ